MLRHKILIERYSSGMTCWSEVDVVPVSLELPISGTGARIKCGVDWDLESQADELLKKSRAGLTKVSDKQDFLTTDQLERRREREVYSQNGVPDANLYCGLFRRAWNPFAGKRPTKTLAITQE